MNVDRTIKLKLSVSEEDKESLKKTITLFNTVFNEVSKYGFENKTHSKVSIHHATYKQIRENIQNSPPLLFRELEIVLVKLLKELSLNIFRLQNLTLPLGIIRG